MKALESAAEVARHEFELRVVTYRTRKVILAFLDAVIEENPDGPAFEEETVIHHFLRALRDEVAGLDQQKEQQ
jgi:hypothetical protein